MYLALLKRITRSARSIRWLVGHAVPGAGGLDDVEELAAHQLGAHEVEDGAPAGEVLRLEPRGRVQLLGPVEAQVAGQDRSGHAEPSRVAGPRLALVPSGDRTVRGRHTSAGVTVVHDVVMDQGRRLEELHRRRHAHQRVGVGLTGGAVAPVEEGGAQSLAPRQEAGDRAEQLVGVGSDLAEDVRLALEELVDTALDALAQLRGVERAVHHRLLQQGLRPAQRPASRGSSHRVPS